MGITFGRVEEVAPGDPVESRHLVQIAESIADRVTSGLGDGAKRMAYLWHCMMRQARNPDETQTQFPPEAEYLQLWQHLAPDMEWPDTGPGDPEGVNLATIMGAFVYGNESAKIDAEDTRLNDPDAGGVPVEKATTPGQLWALGKRQRGAYDPSTGGIGAPAFSAAQSHFALQQSPTSPHGNSYGGWFPTPEWLGDCADGTATTPPTNNYAVRFSSTTGGSARTYPGTCPSDPTNVAHVIEYPLGYYVVLFSGQVDYLPKSKWIEGPYSGGNRLSKAPADVLPRVLNRFAGEFRGSAQQHQDELDGLAPWLGTSFAISDFLTSQYLLAPARGNETSPGLLNALYPTRDLVGVGSAAAGAAIGSAILIRDGFCAAAGYLKATGLVAAVTVEFRSGKTVLGTVTLVPDSTNSAEAIVVFDEPGTGGELGWYLVEGARFLSGGGIHAEIAELWQYKPGLHDLMLVCRLGGARMASIDGTDGSGLSEDDAVGIWEAYAAYGCIPQRREDQYLGGSLDTIGHNAVYDLFRRWSRMVRVIPRQQLLGYAVENGKSILWIQPYVDGLARADRADAMEGIRDAIARKAPPGGVSNRWVMFSEAKRYRNNAESIWKVDVYADWRLFSDRCVVWTPILPALDPQLQRHFNNASPGGYDAKRSYAPETVSGYRYAKRLNEGASQAFYRSCRIYEPPLEIEKAETVMESGAEVVKITLSGRLHHHHSLAPASIARDVSTWVAADLTAEAADYRTEENAIREALMVAAGGTYQCEKTGPGNAAAASDILGGLDIPWGACLPHLCFVQLPPAPYADGGSSQDAQDTPMVHELFSQYELWIRVLSEGFVDGETSVDYGCQTGIEAVFDYKFSNLCYRAFGAASFLTLPSASSDTMPATEVREDKPVGYGQLPTVRPTVEVQNLFAKALNKLTRVRVMLPFSFEVRTLHDSATQVVTSVTSASGSGLACPGGSTGFVFNGDPGDVSTVTETATWAASAYAYSQLDGAFAESGGSYTCSGSNFVVGASRTDQEYRWSLVDPDAIYAMPEAWRNMVATNGEMLAQIDTVRGRVIPVVDGTPTSCNGINYWNDGTGYVDYTTSTVTETVCRLMPATGKVRAPRLGSVTFIGASGSPICAGLAASFVTNLQTLTPIPTDALILNVPLADPGDETA